MSFNYKNASAWDKQKYTIDTIDKNRIVKFKKVMALIPDYMRPSFKLFEDEYSMEKPPVSILDVGCGNGSLHRLLSPSDFESHGGGLQVYGFDFTKHFIDEAMQMNPQNNYFVHDACQPFPVKDFDLIICVELLEHVTAPYVVLENIFNALKPGGSAIVSTPNGLSRELRFNMKKDWKIPQSVFQYMTPTVMEGMIRDIGGVVTYSDWRAKYRFGHIYMRFRRRQDGSNTRP